MAKLRKIALGLLNRLPVLLRKAGMRNFGSHLSFYYFASGSQYIDKVDHFYGDKYQKQDTSPDTPVKDTPLSPELSTPKAMALWKKVQAAGYVDDNFQPLISRTQSALLADAMAEQLGIRKKWKVFEALWNRKNMRSDYNLALRQHQSLDFQDSLKQVLYNKN